MHSLGRSAAGIRWRKLQPSEWHLVAKLGLAVHPQGLAVSKRDFLRSWRIRVRHEHDTLGPAANPTDRQTFSGRPALSHPDEAVTKKSAGQTRVRGQEQCAWRGKQISASSLPGHTSPYWCQSCKYPQAYPLVATKSSAMTPTQTVMAAANAASCCLDRIVSLAEWLFRLRSVVPGTGVLTKLCGTE
eukprot:804296-Rhodomonas_salina.2